MNTVTTPLDADGLYARYGKPLEQSHQGEYIAISQDGQVIVGADDVAVMDQAVQDFGSGHFIFRRIGCSYVDKLRWGDAGQPGLSISPDGTVRFSRAMTWPWSSAAR